MEPVSKAVIKNGTIFLSDGRAVFQYSPNGEYIRPLERRGRSPQGYNGIMDFVLDDDPIYVIVRNMKLLKYTVGNYSVAAEKLDFFPVTIHVTSNGRILLTSAYLNEGDKFNVYDAESLQRDSSFQPISKAEMSYRHIMGQSNFHMYDSRLLYHETHEQLRIRSQRGEAFVQRALPHESLQPPQRLIAQLRSAAVRRKDAGSAHNQHNMLFLGREVAMHGNPRKFLLR